MIKHFLSFSLFADFAKHGYLSPDHVAEDCNKDYIKEFLSPFKASLDYLLDST
jgi:hypothetical protein